VENCEILENLQFRVLNDLSYEYVVVVVVVVPILLLLLVLLFVILSQAMPRVVKLPEYGL
jgi:hypothetical protein